MRDPGFFALIAFVLSFTPAPADAVFSYSLQGTKVSGGEVDAVQANNVAWVTDGDKGKKLQFFLSDEYSEKSEMFAHSLRFAIPAKTGTVVLTPDTDGWSVQLFLGTGGVDVNYTLYGNEAFTITVTSLSATRVSGSFSGKVKAVTGKVQGELLTIADGKFDIPLRTEKR